MSANTAGNSIAWSVEGFERFWSDPNRDATVVPAVITDDVVGHWAGRKKPVHGKAEYMSCIHALLEELPDVRVTVAEHAKSGDVTFVRWILRATGKLGPFEISGIDRIKTRDGKLCENVVVVDTAEFEARAGRRVPWGDARG